MIYEPREDSQLLARYVKIYAHGKVLDLGTGSGIQARTALTKTAEVLAADINAEAVAHCKTLGIPTIQSDLFEHITETFDVIIFNPPYLPEETTEDAESKQITTGGKQGNELLERFFKEAGTHLKPKGIILFVASSLTPDIEKIMNKNGFIYTILEQEKFFFEHLTVYKAEKA
ncbi:MAG: DUF2431 domain-containing protein [Nanoarchaeota archaeon]|nr:DUF2431 domain-containing protein [Nanoarchaeota archaeon]